MTTDAKYTDQAGGTWDVVYVTTMEGDEVTTLGWIDDEIIDKLNAQYGEVLLFTFEGGNMDGVTV
jgi:hypothetical protein